MTTTAYDRLPEAAAEIFGEGTTAERTYDLLTVDVPVGSWIAALEIARDKLGCTYFDWLSAVDEPGTGFRVCAHVVSLEGRSVRRLLVRTTVPHEAPELPSAVEIYAGAAWHERETHEMFGISFTDHPHLVPLLLPDGFEGHPLRKDFVLAARVVKAWPGAKEPGESEHGGPKRRQMLPPGVPDPNEWGPLKGQLPPAAARPARSARTAATGATGDRPPRRARSVSEGSASQTPEATTTPEAPATLRRARSASEGSATQRTATTEEKQGTEATEGKPATPQAPATPEALVTPEAPAVPSEPEAPSPQSAQVPRGSDAPWHKPRPAFDDAAAPEAPAPEGPAPEAPAPEGPAPEGPAPEAPAAADEAAPTKPASPEPTPPETDESAPDSAERPGGDA
ncbi:NADH-quinone oxidoreductase subunit C [Streptomyces sp. NBC_01210]|uniref:NADH-quinone oxidoreductase subunit C n=1 Tax=Streptomyces sp. NBC_01210 TaxID=2903774 RepID=UPI002E154983|nr:NADH-quinone oxidoreductase subunit C [Streptomyces sp. NBC_01210]